MYKTMNFQQPMLFPLRNKEIKNEGEMQSAVVATISDPYGFSDLEFKQYHHVKTFDKKTGFFDVFLVLANRTDIGVLLELKYQSGVKEHELINQAQKYISSSLYPKPAFYCGIWRKKDQYYIGHYDLDNNPLPRDLWKGHFPDRQELIKFYEANSHTRVDTPKLAVEPQFREVLSYLNGKDWTSLHSFLDRNFYHRAAHLDYLKVHQLTSLLRINYDAQPSHVKFYSHKLQGDLYDTMHYYKNSKEQYLFALKYAVGGRQRALALYLLGISSWRFGNSSEAINYYKCSLELNIDQLLPNILSELVLAMMGRAIPNEIAARYKTGTVDFMYFARKFLRGSYLTEIEKYIQSIRECDITQPGVIAAVKDVIALWHQAVKDDKKAKNLYDEIFKGEKDYNLDIIHGWSLNNRSIMFFEENNFIEALYFLSRSIKQKKKTGDYATIATSYYNRALTFKALHSDTEYQQDMAAALRYSEILDDRFLQGHIMAEHHN